MKLKRLLAGVVSAAMMLSIGSTLAFAADQGYNDTNKTVTFTSTMNLSIDAVSAPNVTYTYAVTAGASDGATYTYEYSDVTYNIISGVLKDSTTTNIDFTKTAVFSNTDYADSNYQVVEDVTIDFSDVAFTEPGVYAYVITETSNPASEANGGLDTLINEATPVRYVYVVVKNNATSTGYVIADILMYADEITSASDALTDSDSELKSAGFLHSYGVAEGDDGGPGTPGDSGSSDDTQTFVISATAMGDMANANKDFTYTVATTADDNTVFKIDPVEIDSTTYSYVIADGGTLYFATQTNTGGTFSYTATTTEFTFDLASTDSMTIYGVGVVDGKSFTVTIDDDASDGYDFYAKADAETTWSDIADDGTGSYTVVLGTEPDEYQGTDVYGYGTDFATVRGAGTDADGIEYAAAYPETGVVLDLLPYVVMVALAGAFITFRVVKSARRDEE